MTIIFYNSGNEKNVVVKTLSNGTTMTGTLRMPTSVLNPIVIIENSTFPTWNYAYISEFSRYYFITNVVSVNNDLWQIEMKVDVLMSFSANILTQTAFVARNEYDEDNRIADIKRPALSRSAISYSEFSTDPFNVVENGIPTVANQKKSYVLVLASSLETSDLPQTYGAPTDISPLVFPNGQQYMTIGGSQTLIATKWEEINNLFDGTSNTDNVVAVISFPFDVVTRANPGGVFSQDDTFNFNGYTLTGRELSPYYSSIIDLGSKTVTGYYSDWRDYEPYTEYKLYMPYIGYVSLPSEEIVDNTIYVKYAVDMSNGNANAFVICNSRIIYTQQCQIGIQIPLSRSNAYEWQRNNMLNFMSGISGIGKIVAGGKTANPALIAKGISDIGSSVYNTMHNHLMISGALAQPNVSRYSPSKCGLYVQRQQFYTLTDYGHMVGYPVNNIDTLNTYHGFTVCESVHLDGFSTAIHDELAEIETLLKSGVILPDPTP